MYMLLLQIAKLLSISLLERNESGEFTSKKTDLHGLWDPSNFESSACQGVSHALWRYQLFPAWERPLGAASLGCG